jgi:hypothetical protein
LDQGLERLGEDLHASLYFSKAFKYCYVNNPKAACSSIKKILWAAETDSGAAPRMPQRAGGEQDLLNRKPNTADDCRPWMPLDAPIVEDVSDRFYFTFVRNPFARALSAYLDKIAGRPNIHKREFHRFFGLPADRRLSFGEFLELVERQPVSARDPHWRDQCVSVALDLVPYDLVGKCEALAPDLARVCAVVGLGAVDPAGNSFMDHATHASDKLRAYYGPREEDAVRRIYREDFERLCYPAHLADAASAGGEPLAGLGGRGRHDRMVLLRMILESLGTALQDVRMRQIDRMLAPAGGETSFLRRDVL